MASRHELVTVAVLSTLLAVGLLGGVTVVAGSTTAPSPPPAETTELRPNVSVWERAAFPLRADVDEATTVVDNQDVFVDDPEGRQIRANRDEVGVFDTGHVPIEFSRTTGANVSHFADAEVEVIVAHLDDRPDVSGLDTSLVPTSIDEARSLLDAETRSALNANVTFSESSLTLDGSGEGSYTLDASTPGQYGVVFVAGDVFDVADGNVTLTDSPDGTVVGVEGVPVQSGRSHVVDPFVVRAGEDASFHARTDLSGNVSHSVVLYNEETFTDSATTFNVTRGVSPDLDADDVIVEHELTRLNGVADVDADVSMFGLTLPESRSGAVLLEDVVSFAADTADITEPRMRPVDNVTLDGSAVAVDDAGSRELLTVDTFANWTEGTYRWVHVAAETNSTRQFETTTGTVVVTERQECPPHRDGDHRDGDRDEHDRDDRDRDRNDRRPSDRGLGDAGFGIGGGPGWTPGTWALGGWGQSGWGQPAWGIGEWPPFDGCHGNDAT